jgi:hypothetical protein
MSTRWRGSSEAAHPDDSHCRVRAGAAAAGAGAAACALGDPARRRLIRGCRQVGNDPTWADGGPDGRYRDYWTSYAFGNLSETAKMRREVLTRLIPRLKIAARCQLSERFLVVRGDIRTCKIHLGSGNILMEPNDQYLCIVPARGAGSTNGDGTRVVPFEGDGALAIILSKALLLADDTAIDDPTIVRQVRR